MRISTVLFSLLITAGLQPAYAQILPEAELGIKIPLIKNQAPDP